MLLLLKTREWVFALIFSLFGFWSQGAIGEILTEAELTSLKALHESYAKKQLSVSDLQTEITKTKLKLNTAEALHAGLETDVENARKNYQQLEEIAFKNPNDESLDALVRNRKKQLGEVSVRHSEKGTEIKQLKDNMIVQQANLQMLESELRATQSRFDTALLAYLDRHSHRRIQEFNTSVAVQAEATATCGEDVTPRACRERAIIQAERKAVDQGSVVMVKSLTKMENFQLTHDEVRSELNGKLSNKSFLADQQGIRKHYIKLSAVVTPVMTRGLKDSLSENAAQEFRSYMRMTAPQIAYWPSTTSSGPDESESASAEPKQAKSKQKAANKADAAEAKRKAKEQKKKDREQKKKERKNINFGNFNF